jgi:hypothetical protein
VNLDISWDEVAKWITADAQALTAWMQLLVDYPERFLFGTDSLAPKTQADYFQAYDVYNPLWDRLDRSTAQKVKLGNYERIFDAARTKVRDWEARQPVDR